MASAPAEAEAHRVFTRSFYGHPAGFRGRMLTKNFFQPVSRPASA